MDGKSLEAAGKETLVPGALGSDSGFWSITLCASAVLETVLGIRLCSPSQNSQSTTGSLYYRIY